MFECIARSPNENIEINTDAAAINSLHTRWEGILWRGRLINYLWIAYGWITRLWRNDRVTARTKWFVSIIVVISSTVGAFIMTAAASVTTSAAAAMCQARQRHAYKLPLPPRRWRERERERERERLGSGRRQSSEIFSPSQVLASRQTGARG